MNRRRATSSPKGLTFALSLLAVAGCTKMRTIAKDDVVVGDAGRTSEESPTGGEAAVSGTRLKARSLAAEDGARHFAGWYDSEREVECSFQRAADGTIRCLPASASVNSTWFADASCTKPLAYVLKGCDAPKTASLQASYCATFASSPVKIFALAGVFRGSSYYTKVGAGCNAAPASSLIDTYDLFSVGAEIAPSEFVGATETVE